MSVKRGGAVGCLMLSWLLVAGSLDGASAQTKPEGEMRWALHVTLSPLWFDYIWPSGVGPRVAEPALMLINPYPWSAPPEEVRLKKP